MNNKPVYWKCGGGPLPYVWGYGFWTGKDNDLLCIKPNVRSNPPQADEFLLPICDTKKQAKAAFLNKRKEKGVR